MKYLHEIVKGHAWFHDNWETRHDYIYVWEINDKWIKEKKLIAEVPIRAIKKIEPFRYSHHMYKNETLVVTFHAPYNVYDEWCRIKTDELIKVINRKKKYQSLKLVKKMRYFYVEMMEE